MWGMARPGLFSKWRSRVHTPTSGRCNPVLQPWWLTDTFNQSLSTLRHPHCKLDSPSLGAVDFQVHLGIFAYLPWRNAYSDSLPIISSLSAFCDQVFGALCEVKIEVHYQTRLENVPPVPWVTFLVCILSSLSSSSSSSSSASFQAQKFFWWNPVVSVFNSVVCALVSQMSNVLCV